jgi:carbonic anhydrase
MFVAHRSVGMLLAISGAVSRAFAADPHPAHWDYVGEVGPEHWVEFGTDFSACAGKNQSPIDLARFIEAELPAIAFAYQAGGSEITNNGHSIQVNYGAGSSISIDSIGFALKQFHFHAPSENRIEGKSFPIEAHCVHADASGHLAVVALMVASGETNAALEKLWAHMPSKEGETNALAPAFAAIDLLPASRDYYRYEGSLTTPPCSEGVRWLVLKQPVTASAAQISTLTEALGRPNNRPVQALGARAVLQ